MRLPGGAIEKGKSCRGVLAAQEQDTTLTEHGVSPASISRLQSVYGTTHTRECRPWSRASLYCPLGAQPPNALAQARDQRPTQPSNHDCYLEHASPACVLLRASPLHAILLDLLPLPGHSENYWTSSTQAPKLCDSLSVLAVSRVACQAKSR